MNVQTVDYCSTLIRAQGLRIHMRKQESSVRSEAISILEIAAFSLVILASLSVPFTQNARAANVAIAVRDNFFDPSTQTVQVGDTVTWTNLGVRLHTVTSNPSGPLSSGDMAPGSGTYSFTFTSSGIYNYKCIYHASLGMTGTITVVSGVPEFPSMAFAAVGVLVMFLGLVFSRRIR